MEIKNQTSTMERVNKQMEDWVKEAKIYPTWAVIVFFILLIFNFAVVIYLIFKL